MVQRNRAGGNLACLLESRQVRAFVNQLNRFCAPDRVEQRVRAPRKQIAIAMRGRHEHQAELFLMEQRHTGKGGPVGEESPVAREIVI